jgi:DUF4097 and DUF4098 domain-containing protein YvlB
MKLIAIGAILLLPVLALSSTFVQTKQMALPAGNINKLSVQCGAGSLYIINAEGQNSIRVFAEIEVDNLDNSDHQGFAEKNVVLSLDRQGKRALLKSDLIRSVRSRVDARINLTIEVPGGIDVFIDDGSGPIHIQYFSGHLDIKDDSGLITIENIVGNVRVADGSGKIILEDIRGNVEVRDGSGIIDVNKIRGDVRVTDGSGPISIQYVEGNVTVTDGSGTIDINDIAGNVLIREPGTGELNVKRVKGTVTTQNQIEDISPKILNE